MVDVEADGPIPGEYSMISIGAVFVEPSLSKTFYGEMRPISDNYVEDALSVSGFSREETLNFDKADEVMKRFDEWIQKNNSKGRPRFVSDNNGFDWMFVCWYFHKFLQSNPFGHSSTNLGSLYKGFVKNDFENFKRLRKTKHTHNALDDAKGNAEAFLTIKKMGYKVRLD